VDERQAIFQDDDDDTFLFGKLKEHVVEKYPNPERIGCIGHSTLNGLGLRAGKAGSFRSEISACLEVRRVHA